MLEICDIHKIYSKGTAQETVVLQGASFSFQDGVFYAIIGKSGCGKTTLLHILGGLDVPDQGKVLLDGVDLFGLSRRERAILRRRRMGFIFQSYNLLQEHTAWENIAMPYILDGKRVDQKRLNEVCSTLEIEKLLHKYPVQLSGGEQQRIAIARAIVNEPKVLLLDEPLGALDLKLRQDMQYELIRLKNELGITFLYVTHDQEEALTMSDSIVVMNQGYIQQIGTPEDIYNEPVNAFVADFIGESNIIDGVMIEDHLVEILDTRFPCVDEGFGQNCPVDVVIRPEDVELVEPEEGIIDGTVISIIFKGVHYEIEVLANGFEWLVHTTKMHEVGSEVGIRVIPFNIQIMNKPESSDEEAVEVDA